ncbi:MAG: glycosyltransferase [Flavobacteriales bacterium]|nr:glycosyltransferase [Flavobacteriales bacterium]
MKKVLVITYYWPPSGGAGVQRWVKFIKYFKNQNIDPYIISVDPDFASYPVIDKSLINDIPENTNVYLTKTNEPYSIYKKINNNQTPYAGFANEGRPNFLQKIARFVRGNFFIPDSRKGWNDFAYKKAVKVLEKENIDTVITTSPPHSTQLIGLKLKETLNIKWIADLRDPWTDIYYYKSMLHTKWAKRKDLNYEKAVIEKSDKIVVVSDSIKQLLINKSNLIQESKIHVIPNGFDEEDFSVSSTNKNNKFLLSYVGTITKDYPLDSIKKSITNLNINLEFTGKADHPTKHLLNEIAVFNNHVKHKESINLLLASDMLLLVIPKIANNKGILTGKLFEYLGARKPILCIGPTDGDAAKIIKECKAGKIFDYSDENGIYEFIETCMSNEFIFENKNYLNYSRRNLTKTLSKILNDKVNNEKL